MAEFAPQTLANIRDWLAQELAEPVELNQRGEQRQWLAVTYPTHRQTAFILQPPVRRREIQLPLLVIRTTFCALPGRMAAVTPLLAMANTQLERGRWYCHGTPPRLTMAMELPIALLNSATLGREWLMFRDAAIAHGIELTLKTRGKRWLDVRAALRHGAAPSGTSN